jgi:uncharacterized protein YndB with AHSA1/START domain
VTTIERTYTFNAPVEKVWWALTTAEGAEQWGAGPAKFDTFEGGKFSYWDGDIHGINTKIMPQMLLEQDWYGHDHPERKYMAKFALFTRNDGKVDVHLTHSGDHDDIDKDLADWDDYYFNPIKKLLEE